MIRIRLMHEGKAVKQISSRLHEGIVLEQIARFKEQYDTVQILEGELSEDAKSMLHHVAKKIVPAALAAGMAMSGAHAQQGGANPNYPGMDRSIGQHISDIVSPDYKEKMRQRDYEKDTQRQEWNAKQNEIRRQRIEASRGSVSNTPGVQKNVTVYDQARPSADGKFYVIYGMDDRVTRIPVVGTEFMAADSQRLAHYIAPNGQVYYVRHAHNTEPVKQESTTLFNGVTESDLTEGVAETLPMNDAVKLLRKYGADNFKTTSNELHFYKNGKPLSVVLVMNPDSTRSVTLSSLNAATRGLKGVVVGEGVAETLSMDEAKKVLRHYGADHFKTTSNELHFYKNGKPFSVGLTLGADGVRSVSLSSLNSATRSLKEGYTITPGIDKERYQERPGLEGPFTAKNGKVVYYDKVEGKYYDPDTDFYLGNDDWQAMNEGDPNAKVGTIPMGGTKAPVSTGSSATDIPGAAPGAKPQFAPTGQTTPAKFNAQGQLELDPGQHLDADAENTLKQAGVQVAEGSDTLDSILGQYSADYAKFKEGGDIDENEDFFNALYEYYSENGQMPYGIQKARDGDPYEWITNQLDQEDGAEPVAEADEFDTTNNDTEQSIIDQIQQAGSSDMPTEITLADNSTVSISQQTAEKILMYFNKLMPASKELMQTTLNTQDGFNQLLDYFGETAVATESSTIHMEAQARARSIIKSVFGQ